MVDCCCCCIPVRLGTIILAVISLIFAISGAAAYLGKPDEIAIGMPQGVTTIFGFLFIVMALISIFGIIGSLFSSPGAVRLFEWMLWGFVLAWAIISITTIVSLFKNKQLAIDRCIDELQGKANSTVDEVNSSNADKVVVSDVTNATTGEFNERISGEIPEVCRNRETLIIWLKTIFLTILTLLAAYFAGVTSRFADELKRDHRHRGHKTRNIVVTPHFSTATPSSTDVKAPPPPPSKEV